MRDRIKKIVSFLLLCFLIIFCSLFSISNKLIVKVNFFPLPYVVELPMYILIFLLILIGFLLGFLFVYLRKVL